MINKALSLKTDIVEIAPIGMDPLDYIEGPYSVHSDRVCSCCGASSVVVENAREEKIYEACKSCGLDEESASSTILFN